MKRISSKKEYYFSEYLGEGTTKGPRGASLLIGPILLLMSGNNSTAWVALLLLEIIILSFLYLGYSLKLRQRTKQK